MLHLINVHLCWKKIFIKYNMKIQYKKNSSVSRFNAKIVISKNIDNKVSRATNQNNLLINVCLFIKKNPNLNPNSMSKCLFINLFSSPDDYKVCKMYVCSLFI